MDPRLASELGSLSNLSHRRIFHVLESESPRRYDLTKALVDVLYNLCVVRSIETGEKQQKVFEKYVDVIRPLVTKKTSLRAKKNLLQANIPLVMAVVETCRLNA